MSLLFKNASAGLVVFVPEYVNVDDIDKCFCDRRVTFEAVNSETFDAAAQQESHFKFMFLEKDHFLVYIRGSEPFKCHYQSRNRIMVLLYGGCSRVAFDGTLKEVNGLRMVKQQPIHYFVRSAGSDALGFNNATEDNTIVEYFDSDDDLDLAKFAEIVKGKPNCVQKHFIVNKGAEYRAVETDNVENTYVFSGRLKYRIVSALAAGAATLDTFIEEDRRLEDNLAKPERQPGFKLRDASGEVIADGETFALQILGDREGDNDDDDEDMEEMLSKLSKEERLRYGKDWVGVNSYMNDGKDYFLCGNVDYGADFECETVDGIVYLKNDGGYLQFDSDDDGTDIYISAKIPPKDKRVQIHYNSDGDISLTAWGGRIYAVCDWVKCSYGGIYLCDNEEQLRWGSPMRLRVVKL